MLTFTHSSLSTYCEEYIAHSVLTLIQSFSIIAKLNKYLLRSFIHSLPPSVQAVKNALHTHFLPQAKIHEFYITDIDKVVEEFRRRISSAVPTTRSEEVSKNQLVIIQDPQYGRKTCKVDMDIAVRLYNLPK